MASAAQQQQAEDSIPAMTGANSSLSPHRRASAPLPPASEQARLMQLALDQAARCEPTPSAFCVGCVVADSTSGVVLAAGFSRELPSNTHAEANALDKLVDQHGEAGARELLQRADLYTTMEPCSVRLSGNTPCSVRILALAVPRVFLGTVEPADFVNCEGVRQLTERGVAVHTVAGFAERCLEAARRGH